MHPFIVIENLQYVYPLESGEQIVALRDVNLSIERGEFVALIGPNGSGKSTLARHLNALLIPTGGTVWVDGLRTSDPHNVWAVRRKVGMVFQNPDNQLVATTVEEDVAFGPENMGVPAEEIRQRVDEALAIVGLEAYRQYPPQMLSGGQKQLVAIAGALATRPSCLVLDEPTSMLDPVGRRQVLNTIQRLNAEEGITILLITHSMSEAASAQRVLIMNAGTIVMDKPPAEVFAHGAKLQALGLSLPPIVDIAHRLRAEGLPLPPTVLTLQDLVKALCTSA
ncbi:MAG: energy-coupling factor transporter ATPase [Anaerolineae bacterium]|nr:energy-coupling factor transporter ATPase [Anaerolineae bacterium]